jgi:glucose/arabinose dehydrogenase
VVLATIALGLAACGGGGGPEAGSRTTTAPPTTTSGAPGSSATTTAGTNGADPCATRPVSVSGPAGQSTWVSDADFPTALAWAPDGRLFFAQRDGAVKVAVGDEVSTVTTLPTVTTERGGGYSERGLLGLALSPTFARDHYVYVFYSRTDYRTQVVERFTECAGDAHDRVTLLTFPSGDDCCHKGGRIVFGPDGKLYVTLGDEHSVTRSAAGDPDAVPQDPGDVRGKILRYNPDGSIPTDNPFGATSPAFAVGFRNPFGLAFGNGQVFAALNGPTGDAGAPATGYDIATIVTAGGRYQWPACYGYGHTMPGASSCRGLPDPDWSSESSTVVPTGATWVDGSGPSTLAGHFVFCSYGGGMQVVTPGSPHATVTRGPQQCRLDVTQGPDHAVYFADEHAIYRVAPG